MYIVLAILAALKDIAWFYLRNVRVIFIRGQGWVGRFAAVDALKTNLLSAKEICHNLYFYRESLYKKKRFVLDHINSIEEYLSCDYPAEKIKFSFVGASKCRGNVGSNLCRFLNSLISNTSKLDEVEVIVCIENDPGEIAYYLRIKENFENKINLKFIINNHNIKYPDLHKLKLLCVNLISKSTKMVLTFTDDSRIIKKNWDTHINKSIPKSSYYFVNTTRGNLHNLKISDHEDYIILYDLLHGGPISAFTGISIPLLKVMTVFSERHPGWTPFGNSFMCDNFFHMLQRYISKTTKEKITVFPMIELKHGIVPSYKNFQQYAFFSPFMRENWPKFISVKHQDLIKELALEIIKHITNETFNTQSHKAHKNTEPQHFVEG